MHDAVRQRELRREPEVDDAGLRDDARDATRVVSRVASQVARWPPAEWPIATTRAWSSSPAWCAGHLGEVVDRGRDVLERLRVAAAGQRAEPAVLHVPGRPAARHEVFAERVRLPAAVLRLPEAAVDQDGDGEGPVAVRMEELAELAASPSVVMTLTQRHRAIAPPRRAA